MNALVKITWRAKGKDAATFTFREPTECVVGRSDDCAIRIPNIPQNSEVSRHHCVLDIDPPLVWVRDTFSKNGTFVNNKLVDPSDQQLTEVHDGDEIRIGPLVLKVETILDTSAEYDSFETGIRELSGSSH